MSSSEQQEVIRLLDNHSKMLAMLAPSFPVQFNYPQIVEKLKCLGFKIVVEVAVGAAETNRQLLELIKNNPKKRFITSPCPMIVQLIKTQYSRLVRHLAATDSPMLATAKLMAQVHPGFRIVFIGPCPMKKIGAKNYPDLNITVLTYKELAEIFKIKQIKDNKDDFLASFDKAGQQTRLYSVSGGLAQSSGLNEFLTDEEYDIVSGPILVKKVLDDFPQNQKLKILDILNCEGGCINGAGIDSPLTLDQRRLKVVAHWVKSVR